MGGPSAGLLAGGLLVPMFGTFVESEDREDISFVRQTIVQTVWGKLTKMGKIQPANVLLESGDKYKSIGKYESFEFGSDERSFDRFIQIEPIQLSPSS